MKIAGFKSELFYLEIRIGFALLGLDGMSTTIIMNGRYENG